MQLYTRPLSPYCACVRGVLYLKGLPFKSITLPYPFPEDFSQITPLRRVPVLITGSGETLFEASVIAEYLEDHYPITPLLPKSPRERALIRMLVRITELEVLTPALKLFIELSKPDKDAPAIEVLFNTLHRGLSIIEGRLGDSIYTAGEDPTLADAWLLPTRFIMEPLKKLSGKENLLNEFPKFDAYAESMRQNSAFDLVWNEMNDGLIAFMPQLAST